MLDDSDLGFAALVAPIGESGPIGCILSVISLVAIIAIAIAVSNNNDDCSKMKCEHGVPRLALHECLCAEAAK